MPKSSRKERRHQRQKSVRAREHGLPSRPPERPQKAPRQESARIGDRGRSRDGDEPSASSVEPPATERSAIYGYWRRVVNLPTAGKLAVLAVLGVIVLAIVSGMRDRTPEPSRGAQAASTPPAALPSAVLPPGPSEPAASVPAPSPEPGAPAETPRTPESQPSKPRAAMASPSVAPAPSAKTQAPKLPAPKREDNPY
jgi:hypothetical protein